MPRSPLRPHPCRNGPSVPPGADTPLPERPFPTVPPTALPAPSPSTPLASRLATSSLAHSDSQLCSQPCQSQTPASLPLTPGSRGGLKPPRPALDSAPPFPSQQPVPASLCLSTARPSCQLPSLPLESSSSERVASLSFTPLLQSVTHQFFPRITIIPCMLLHIH